MASNYFFSPSTKNFYPKELITEYKDSNSLPDDIIESSQEEYNVYTGLPPSNKTLGAVGNKPTWLPLNPSEVALAELERLWRNNELKRADICLYMAQDSDHNSVGSVSEWREYRKKLRAWPADSLFPDQLSRPIAPDVR
jgi:hypothetical protein